MTDTNQASELYELCREVYEKTGWKPTDWQHGIEDGQPLYTSDYLLEKLPETYNKQELTLWRSGVSSWRAGYSPTESYRDDTPLKALLKLTIALSEAGELDNDQSS